MDREQQGGWVYIMANRYRGTIYTGVTSDMAGRVQQHRSGEGSDFCARHGLNRLVWAERGEDIRACIAQEKRMKRWLRAWKVDLVERGNPDWEDFSGQLL
jgi:putative endonuclease